MDRQVYEKVLLGNIQGIRTLRSMGAGVEWKDREGKTPLILACQRHDRFDVAKALIDFGANVNAYQPGMNGGTPLHHAVIKGLAEIVKLLLANGANPFVRNDDGHNPLDLARQKGRVIILRTIENHISIFSGWLRAERGFLLSDDSRPIPSDFRPWKVLWVVVLPSDTVDMMRPRMLELSMYLAQEVEQPCEVIKLMEINEPSFNEPDPSIVIEDSGKRYKMFSGVWGEKEQIELFYNACQGVLEENDHNTASSSIHVLITPPSAQHRTGSESTHLANSPPEQTLVPRIIPVPGPSTNSVSSPDMYRTAPASTGIDSDRTTEGYTIDPNNIELAWLIGASIMDEGEYIEAHLVPETSTAGTSLSFDEPLPSDSTSEETFYDASTDQAIVTSTAFNDMTTEISGYKSEEREVQENDLCVICLDSQVEAACIPCGHMAGCLACFKKIEAGSKKCPICRAKVNQVVKIYAI